MSRSNGRAGPPSKSRPPLSRSRNICGKISRRCRWNKVTNEAATVVESIRPQRIALPAGLKRTFHNNVVELLALAAGAALWEALGWALRLQWLPPFSKVLTELIAFVRNGAIVAN